MKRNSVVVCFVANRGKILLLKRSQLVGSYRGKWHAIAGYIEKGETPEQTAWKEIREEIQIPKKCLKLVATGKPFEVASKKYACVWVIHPFLFDSSIRKVKLDYEHTEHRWIKPKEITKFDFVPDADRALEKALKAAESPFSR